ncbi:MAG: YfcE family phosphodiesterase [Oscillospiraceae bacterium]|nr:YfcE family phosphodiesterase [Oscillospiraceae bacterium]
MKILVLSDSHSTLSFMRRCIESVAPEVIVHLGDHFDDGEAMREEYPGIPFFQVPGNCDRYRCPSGQPEILIPRIGGVDLYMTHGHRHNVKSYLGALLRDARAAKADAVLYGHTHRPECYQEEGGLWVMNPGSCGYFGGSAGLMECEGGRITACRLIREEDLLMP